MGEDIHSNQPIRIDSVWLLFNRCIIFHQLSSKFRRFRVEHVYIYVCVCVCVRILGERESGVIVVGLG